MLVLIVLTSFCCYQVSAGYITSPLKSRHGNDNQGLSKRHAIRVSLYVLIRYAYVILPHEPCLKSQKCANERVFSRVERSHEMCRGSPTFRQHVNLFSC